MRQRKTKGEMVPLLLKSVNRRRLCIRSELPKVWHQVWPTLSCLTSLSSYDMCLSIMCYMLANPSSGDMSNSSSPLISQPFVPSTAPSSPSRSRVFLPVLQGCSLMWLSMALPLPRQASSLGVTVPEASRSWADQLGFGKDTKVELGP
jgi:hypothetical protein